MKSPNGNQNSMFVFEDLFWILRDVPEQKGMEGLSSV